MPRVSIVIPTCNRKDYVQETIDSVLAQTYTDYEVIVIDDGSNDGTGTVLGARYGHRINYVWQENQGESAARNHGIEISRGEYIALLDSDDLWLPEKLTKQVAQLDANPNTVLGFTLSCPIDADGHLLDSPSTNAIIKDSDLTFESLCLKNAMSNAGSTALIRRKFLDRVGGFDSALQYGEDWDLWLRLRRQGSFAVINEPLAHIRQHSGSQWHNPRPETVDQRLADHLRMLEKAFADWKVDIPAGLHKRSMAWAYGTAGFLDYFIGRTTLGQQRLSQAIQLDPEYRAELQHFPERLKDEFFNLNSGLISDRPVKAIIRDAVEAFEHWPGELPMSDWRKTQLLKKICTHHLFVSYKKGDFSATRYCLITAILHDPALLRNRGVWSIGFEAFLGTWAVNQLRRWIKYHATW